MTAEVGLVPASADISSAISTPQGLFAVALLLWLLLIGFYALAWRKDLLQTAWLSTTRFNNNGRWNSLLAKLLNRTRDLAQARRVYSDQLEVVLEHVNVLVALLDENDNVTYRNSAFSHWVGVEHKEPRPLLSLLSLEPEDERNVLFAVERARTEGFATTHINDRQETLTEPRRFDVRVERTSDIPGTRHVVVSLQDVTRSYRVNQSLLRARKVNLLGSVTSSLVHDLNNLLFVVRSGADLVSLALSDDNKVQEDLKAVSEATHQAAGVTSELLAVSRQRPSNEGPCSPIDILRDNEKTLRRLFTQHTTLSIDLPTAPVLVAISANDWLQILLNLVLNAVQAVGREGKVRISVTTDSQDTVQLAVEDNGTGIVSEPNTTLFEPFVTTKASQGCAGLGLATVKALVDRAGGQIKVTSSRRTGTQVYVQLPTAKDLLMTTDIPSVQPKGNAPTLLVLDDEDQVRRLMVRLLSREGYNILESSTLKECLTKATGTERLDVWVTDANVDGTDATTAVSEMRTLHPNLAIVLVSGREPDEDKMEFLQQHGVTFLAKPFTPTELRQAIDQAYRHGLATSAVVPLAHESASVADRLAR